MKSFPCLRLFEPKIDEEELKEEFQKQNLFTSFRNQLFTEMTKSLEAKQYAQSIFI